MNWNLLPARHTTRRKKKQKISKSIILLATTSRFDGVPPSFLPVEIVFFFSSSSSIHFSLANIVLQSEMKSINSFDLFTSFTILCSRLFFFFFVFSFVCCIVPQTQNFQLHGILLVFFFFLSFLCYVIALMLGHALKCTALNRSILLFFFFVGKEC